MGKSITLSHTHSHTHTHTYTLTHIHSGTHRLTHTDSHTPTHRQTDTKTCGGISTYRGRQADMHTHILRDREEGRKCNEARLTSEH